MPKGARTVAPGHLSKTLIQVALPFWNSGDLSSPNVAEPTDQRGCRAQEHTSGAAVGMCALTQRVSALAAVSPLQGLYRVWNFRSRSSSRGGLGGSHILPTRVLGQHLLKASDFHSYQLAFSWRWSVRTYPNHRKAPRPSIASTMGS